MINCIAQCLVHNKCGIISVNIRYYYFVSFGCIWKLEFVSGHLICREIQANWNMLREGKRECNLSYESCLTKLEMLRLEKTQLSLNLNKDILDLVYWMTGAITKFKTLFRKVNISHHCIILASGIEISSWVYH